MTAQGLQFRAEHQIRPQVAVVEGLYPQPVPDKGQPLFGPVPEPEGEHAHQSLHGGREPPGRDSGQDDFGVAVAAPASRRGLARAVQLGAQGLKVVGFAVVHQDVAAVRRDHGLVPRGGKVHHGQPGVAQPHPGLRVEPRPGAVRPPVGQGRDHPPQNTDKVL